MHTQVSSRGLDGGDVDFVVVVGRIVAQQLLLPRLQMHRFTHSSAIAAW